MNFIPVAFSASQTKAGISNVHESFRVQAGRVEGGVATPFMNAYRVNWVETQWSYVEGEGTASQTMQFWDSNASAFRFHAGAPAGAVQSMSATGLVLTMAATNNLSNTALYSEPLEISTAGSGYAQTVNLTFNQAYCRVQLKFKYADAQLADKTISDISLKPLSSGTYPVSGLCTVSHDWSANPPAAATALGSLVSSAAGAGLDYGSLTLPKPSTTATVPSVEYWYLLPDASSTASWQVSVSVDGNVKTATIAAGKAKWEPGKSYVYTFSISDSATPDLIILNDNYVEPWKDKTISVEIGN